MSVTTTVLTFLVALEFFYIMYIQTITTTSAQTSRIFNMERDELRGKSLNTLLKNMGIYNGLIGLGLVYALFFSSASIEIVRMIFVYIILVATYGSFTSSKKIILTQGGLSILALFSTFL
ncbi:DUF1304 family protein [Carnobacterium sp. PL24RED07]|uniref:DUF1304 domain-containing protein n=1 Tax=unclassified Carnobacterium TaxID=257487 RepID=UPI0011EC26A9|nr:MULTISPECIES: DUF1304 domain-containing protein [unclassified Carnobacterium]KAF3303350.1 DUF1304 family protein [Carnobacterium sp. PL26RED25]KAF3306634.1 DUF1304 family protein [Carnobacterium sp. PL24RED07]